MRCFLYARKSTEDKRRQIQSIGDQKTVLHRLARDRGLEIVETFEDEKSAKDIGRAGFDAMISRIKASTEPIAILCWNMDRLSRNPKDSGELMWMLQKSQIEAIVTPERTYYPADSSILMSVETGRSTDVIRKLSTDVKRGMSSKIDKGWMPTKAPIGYRNETEGLKGQKRIFKGDYFNAVQRLWQHLLETHCTLADLYRYMKSDSPLYVKHEHIAFSSFCRIFRNPFYTGLYGWKGELKVGEHPPMITAKEFEDVQKLLSKKSRTRTAKNIFPFKGLFHCAQCGAIITAERHSKFVKATNTITDYDFYRCCHRKKCITKCTEKPMKSTAIEDTILKEISSLYLPHEIIEFGLQKIAEHEESKEESPDVRQWTKALNHLLPIIRTMEKNIAVETDSETRAIIKAELEKARIEAKNAEEQLCVAKGAERKKLAEIQDSLQLFQMARDVFQNGSDEERRSIIRKIGSNWKIKGQSLIHEPNLVPHAIRTTKKQLLLKNPALEPMMSESQSNVTCSLDMASTIWSG